MKFTINIDLRKNDPIPGMWEIYMRRRELRRRLIGTKTMSGIVIDEPMQYASYIDKEADARELSYLNDIMDWLAGQLGEESCAKINGLKEWGQKGTPGWQRVFGMNAE